MGDLDSKNRGVRNPALFPFLCPGCPHGARARWLRCIAACARSCEVLRDLRVSVKPSFRHVLWTSSLGIFTRSTPAERLRENTHSVEQRTNSKTSTRRERTSFPPRKKTREQKIKRRGKTRREKNEKQINPALRLHHALEQSACSPGIEVCLTDSNGNCQNR